MNILGINGYCFDASVALAADGVPLFYAEEERFNREKKTREFPRLALAAMLETTGIDSVSIDRVVCPWDPWKGFVNSVKIALSRFPQSLALLSPTASTECNMVYGTNMLGIGRAVRRAIPLRPGVSLRYLDHHDCHAALAFFTSPFEQADVLVMDGFGDDCSMSRYAGSGPMLARTHRNTMFESLGLLYSVITRHLGFAPYREEGTVMGLAAHGDDRFVAPFRSLVHLLDGGEYRLDWDWLSFDRYGEMRPFTRRFVDVFGPGRRTDEPIGDRHKALARALQQTTQETLLHITRAMARRSTSRRLAFAGGVALNCLANGLIARDSGYEAIHVPAAPGDGGTSLGAALYASHVLEGVPRTTARATAYLGARYSDQEVRHALGKARLDASGTDDPAREAARLLAAGLVVGWFQGRTEMGPRALGGRSVLADPRSPSVAARLNTRIKLREPFRPYAPSVLAHRVAEWFDGTADSPFMSFALPARASLRSRISAVLQVDGTARLQTVTPADQPLFHRLISHFESLTGVPMVLNTSFNRRAPIVETPAHAVEAFQTMGLDALVIGDCVHLTDEARRTLDAHAVGTAVTRDPEPMPGRQDEGASSIQVVEASPPRFHQDLPGPGPGITGAHDE